jgi:hypothetical protein
VSPCTAPHLVCDDFDDLNTSLTDRGWLEPYVTNGSTLTVDTLDSVSAPRSVSVVATPNGSCIVERAVSPPTEPSDLTLAFDLRVEDPGSGVALAHVGIETYHARLVVRGDGTITVDEWDDGSGRVSAARASSTAIAGRWAHLRSVGDGVRAVGVRRRVYQPSPGFHPGLPVTDPLVLEWNWGGRTQRIELWAWRPDGGPYEGLPQDDAAALTRRNERVRITTRDGEDADATSFLGETRPFTMAVRTPRRAHSRST